MYLLQVNKIAAAFALQPPIYLVKLSDNTAIFPNETSGQFLSTSLTVGTMYDVHVREAIDPWHLLYNTPSTTSTTSTWSRSRYAKLGGVPDETDRSKHVVEKMFDKDTCSEPLPKKSKLDKGKSKELPQKANGISSMLDDVIKRLDSIDHRTRLFEDLEKSSECRICTSTCRKPMVVPCCGRLFGCRSCVECWLRNNPHCPLCRVKRILLLYYHEIVYVQ